MSSRKVPFVNEQYYHVFNRGVARMQIFNNFYDYHRFKKTAFYYSIEGPKPKFSIFSPTSTILNANRKIVEIVCYCFMPNHFHFLLKQNREGGITEFLSKLSNSYAKYFNIKNKREGPLLQGDFKAVFIETNEQLLSLSRYIHLNPFVNYLTKDLNDYKWSSYLEFLTLESNICNKDVILEQFKSASDYKQFVLDSEDSAKRLEMIKHQLLDYEN